MNTKFKYSRIHLFAGMALLFLLLHGNIYRKRVIDLDEHIYMFLAENTGWDWSNYSTAKAFTEGTHPRQVYASPVFHHPPLYPYLIKTVSIFMSPYTAAKTCNLLFMFAGLLYLYLLAELLFGKSTALLSSGLLLICPLYLMETNLIHMDQYQAFFLLAGIFHFFYSEKNRKRSHLYLSGLFFALAMFVKFTSPVFFIFPVILSAKRFLDKSDKRKTVQFLAIASLGFAWWIYIGCRFGSLFPVEILGDGATILVEPDKYLIEISKRKWWQVWVISAAVSPLFIFFYIPGLLFLIKKAVQWFKEKKLAEDLQILIYINLATVLSMLAFSVGNSYANGHWAIRYFLPIYPFVYLLSAWSIVKLIKKEKPAMNSWIITITCSSVFLMLFSCWDLILHDRLMIQPILFFFLPGLKNLLLT